MVRMRLQSLLLGFRRNRNCSSTLAVPISFTPGPLGVTEPSSCLSCSSRGLGSVPYSAFGCSVALPSSPRCVMQEFSAVQNLMIAHTRLAGYLSRGCCTRIRAPMSLRSLQNHSIWESPSDHCSIITDQQQSTSFPRYGNTVSRKNPRVGAELGGLYFEIHDSAKQ